MINIQAIADKTAVSLSVLCSIHCLATPLVVLLIPALTALPLADEAFHLWMIYGVLPISLFALTMGCKKHRHYQLFFVGGFGLSILVLSVIMGHEILGEFWEKCLTLLGTSIIALGHYWNYQLCQKHDECECPSNT